jgi:hypothetical protein
MRLGLFLLLSIGCVQETGQLGPPLPSGDDFHLAAEGRHIRGGYVRYYAHHPTAPADGWDVHFVHGSGVGHGTCAPELRGHCADILPPYDHDVSFTHDGRATQLYWLDPASPRAVEAVQAAVVAPGRVFLSHPVAHALQDPPSCARIGGTNDGNDLVSPGLHTSPALHGLQAMPLTMSRDGWVSRLEIRTGLAQRPSGMRLYADEAGLPGELLGTGVFRIETGMAWQGAWLEDDVAVSAGETVWVVWEVPAGAGVQTPTAPTGATTVPHAMSWDHGETWEGPYSLLRWKVRAHDCAP